MTTPVDRARADAAVQYRAYEAGWIVGASIKAMEPAMLDHGGARIRDAYQLGYAGGQVARRNVMRGAAGKYGHEFRDVHLASDISQVSAGPGNIPSMHLATFIGEAGTWLEGVEVRLDRGWDGKGFTAFAVTGPRAVELADFVESYVAERLDRWHLRSVIRYSNTVQAFGCSRRCDVVFKDALHAYAAEVTGANIGATIRVKLVPVAQVTPSPGRT